MTSRIHKLPSQLVDQIAAGEVVERPASVVKELVENSIDAGATRVVVALENGGSRLIEVTDNGLGIDAEDLELAVSSHATSKLSTEADLHRIATLGFRGEALASIASVSEFELASRPPDRDAADRIRVTGGHVERTAPVRLEPGTRVTVRELFSRVPARKRFLKSARAESSRVRGVIEKIALAHPFVDLTLLSDGREIVRYPAREDEKSRVSDVLGRDTTGRLLALSSPGGRRIRGFIGRPDLHKRNSDGLRIFVGGRCIQDKTVLHAIRDAYRDFQIPGHYPVAVIHLDLEPDEYDVNVHPQKSEVRFRDSGQIHQLVRHAIKDVLQDERSVPGLSSAHVGPLVPKGQGQYWAKPGTKGWASKQRPDSSLHEPSILEPPIAGLPDSGLPDSGMPDSGEVGRAEPSGLDRSDRVSERFDPPAIPQQSSLVDEHQARVFQVRNAYLVVESEEGMAIIDQHALHEKVLYEEISKSREVSTTRQPLAVPETMTLDTREQETLAEAGEAIAKLGFEIDEFGEVDIAIRAVPAGLARRGAASLLREVLDRLGKALESGAPGEIDLDHEVVSTLACKRAVKAGQPLSASEQTELVRARHRAFQPQNCPHGRPAEIFIRWDELDRRFDRK